MKRRIRENVDVAVKVDRNVKKQVKEKKELRRIIADGERGSGAHSVSAFKYETD